jgi:signal transduction histidine kinase
MQGNQSLGEPFFPHGQFRVRVLLAMIRNRWFVRLRWVFVTGTLALLITERLETPDFERPHAIAACVLALALVNILWMVLGRDLVRATDEEGEATSLRIDRVVRFANAQMTVDLLLLTIILRYSGGIENPMAIFYLFHMLIAALLLRPFNALLQGFWALLLYGGLVIGECMGLIAPHYPFLADSRGLELHTHWGYVLAGVAVLAAGVFGTLYFTLQISLRLDEQERELQGANDALRKTQVAIQDLQARRSRFMQTAAHQLKSPLAGIETLAGLIRDKVVSPEGVSGIIARIIARCEQAIAQVTELLTLARLGEMAPTRHRTAHTDVRQVVEQVAARFIEQATAEGLTLEVETGGEGKALIGVDGRDFEDCLSNLVENAIKYTPEGGAIRVVVTEDEETVSISITDTGMGIAEDSVDDIFDPFRRGNLALSAGIPGTGLGLAIVREVVEQANGRVSVRSTVGKGSDFIVSFPKRREAVLPQPIRNTKATTLDVDPTSTTERE